MKSKIILLISLIGILFQISCNQHEIISSRESEFNSDWKFYRFDIDHGESPGLNDNEWRMVDLPHDYSIEDLPAKEGVKQIGPFSEESAGGMSTGHVVGGTAWYRKHFTLNKEDEGKIIKVLFDGIYMNADVWINGKHLGNHPYGYTAFSFDLTEHLKSPGEENVLAVQVKNEGENSRWYSGSGIYRNVCLIKTAPIYVDIWGNYITTNFSDGEKAEVNIQSKIINAGNVDKEILVKTEITDNSGNVIAISEEVINAIANKEVFINRSLTISNPNLWGPDNPILYALTTNLKHNEKIIDQKIEKFGIRNIKFSAEGGFLLNGESILLKGACIHHDNGILGAAAFNRAEYRKVEVLKKYGYNAIRTAHNPPSKAFLDACDALGMLVIDESFDQWQLPKKAMDYNLYFDTWWEKDMESMLLRDRNHPSIIIWSFGNEIKERADSSGLAIARKLIDKIHALDPTRPATQAICKFWEFPGRQWEDSEPAFALLDVHGYNYELGRYEIDHAAFPDRIMFGSESIAGEIFENWQQVKKHAWVIGDFVWTGMDYLGESGIGRSMYNDKDSTIWLNLPSWPWFNANCGDIDILGNRKPQGVYKDVVWGNSELEMAVHEPVPEGMYEHYSYWGWPLEEQRWNWPGYEGTPLQVSVYSNYDEVRLELNGKPIGTQPISEETRLTATFRVPYEPGELTAIGLKGGKIVATKTLKTTGKSSEIIIAPERENMRADKNELAYFNVEILDDQGLLIPDADIPVEFTIEGKGILQAVGNAKPDDMKSFQKPEVITFRGRCQLIVRSNGERGEISVTAKSPGLKSGLAKVKVL